MRVGCLCVWLWVVLMCSGKCVQAQHLAIMAVSSKDWPTIAQMAADSRKVVPCFGVHPWQAHAHASKGCSSSATVRSVLEKEPRKGSEDITSKPLIHVRMYLACVILPGTRGTRKRKQAGRFRCTTQEQHDLSILERAGLARGAGAPTAEQPEGCSRRIRA
jgi:TatD related DNase